MGKNVNSKMNLSKELRGERMAGKGVKTNSNVEVKDVC